MPNSGSKLRLLAVTCLDFEIEENRQISSVRCEDLSLHHAALRSNVVQVNLPGTHQCRNVNRQDGGASRNLTVQYGPQRGGASYADGADGYCRAFFSIQSSRK